MLRQLKRLGYWSFYLFLFFCHEATHACEFPGIARQCCDVCFASKQVLLIQLAQTSAATFWMLRILNWGCWSETNFFGGSEYLDCMIIWVVCSYSLGCLEASGQLALACIQQIVNEYGIYCPFLCRIYCAQLSCTFLGTQAWWLRMIRGLVTLLVVWWG